MVSCAASYPIGGHARRWPVSVSPEEALIFSRRCTISAALLAESAQLVPAWKRARISWQASTIAIVRANTTERKRKLLLVTSVPRQLTALSVCWLALTMSMCAVAEEPVFPTVNRSLPAAHLSASLTAHIVGITANGLSGASAREALCHAVCSDTALLLPQLAKSTGVSIARFERLMEQVAAADAEGTALGLPHAGTTVLLNHLWCRSTRKGKRSLWTFLETLHVHYGPVLTDEAWQQRCDGTNDAGSTGEFDDHAAFCAHELGEKAVKHAMARLAASCSSAQATGFTGGAAASSATRPDVAAAIASALEVVAAAAALGGLRSAPLLQGEYGYAGQPPVADCVELVTRELFNALLWDPLEQRFDAMRLPSSASDALRQFYAADGVAHVERAVLSQRVDASPAPHATRRIELHGVPLAEWQPGLEVYTPASETWFEMVSGLDQVDYLAGAAGTRYEMAPSVNNMIACVGALLGHRLRTVGELEQLWTRLVPHQPICLRVNATGDRLVLLQPAEAESEVAHVTAQPRAEGLFDGCGSEDGAATCEGGGSSQPSSAGDAPYRGFGLSHYTPSDGSLGGSDGGEQQHVRLTIVMSEHLNHAFAIHNWAAAQWQREVAQEGLRMLRAFAGRRWHARRSIDFHSDAEPPAGAAERAALEASMAALMPSLLQPLLPQRHLEQRPTPSLDAIMRMPSRDDGRPASARPLPSPPPSHQHGAMRRDAARAGADDDMGTATHHLRLMLLSADPRNDMATGQSLLRFLAAPRHSSGGDARCEAMSDSGRLGAKATPDINAATSTPQRTIIDDGQLAAQVLLRANGMEGLSDDDLIRLARAMGTSPLATGEQLCAAALSHAPLAAPAAILTERSHRAALSAWWRAISTGWGIPWSVNELEDMARCVRCLRLSIRALPVAIRLRAGGSHDTA